ncbi:MAG: hypothetical protein KatS3mg104_2599 [Phycisphaerae bacterium]|jgi:HEAT repeat protein|nr:MAG: hypothetical protein KatS3mg104_2599 [Phycisphaerae bacterium]
MIVFRTLIFLLTMLVGVSVRAEDLALIPYGPIAAPVAPEQVVVNPRTVEMIGQALRITKDVPTRARWVADLGRCPVPQARILLQKLLSDPDPLIRSGAIHALRHHPQTEPEILIGLLDDPSPLVRQELIRSGLSQAIVRGVQDNDPAVRTAALGRSVDVSTDQAILQQLPELDPTLQVLGIRTLARRGYEPCVPVITGLLNSESVAVRVSALEGLCELRAITREQIDAQLKHAHSSVRVAAVRASRVLNESDRTTVARTGLSDPDVSVRAESARLEVTGDSSWVSIYFDQLSVGYRPLREASRDALVRLAGVDSAVFKMVVDRSIALLTDSDPHRRIDGSYLLGQLRSNAGLEKHLRLLEDDDWRVVDQAVRSMGLIKDPRTGEALIRVIQRAMDEKNVSSPDQVGPRFSAAEQAILSCVELNHVPVLQTTASFNLRRTAQTSVRTASVYALGRLGTSEQVFSSLRALLSRVADPEESPTVVIEAIKSMGNARVSEAVPVLEKIRQDQNLSSDYQYAAHLALARIRGEQPSEFIPPTIVREPDTSLRAIDP